MRVLAGLFQPMEAETPYGGRSVSFEAVGSAWLKCGRAGAWSAARAISGARSRRWAPRRGRMPG